MRQQASLLQTMVALSDAGVNVVAGVELMVIPIGAEEVPLKRCLTLHAVVRQTLNPGKQTATAVGRIAAGERVVGRTIVGMMLVAVDGRTGAASRAAAAAVEVGQVVMLVAKAVVGAAGIAVKKIQTCHLMRVRLLSHPLLRPRAEVKGIKKALGARAARAEMQATQEKIPQLPTQSMPKPQEDVWRRWRRRRHLVAVVVVGVNLRDEEVPTEVVKWALAAQPLT
mmetsp:Transcript_129503/g.242243  ORF Transcript_129503/g.242243 Transcript_129503/m.242243 type:complete len:225 (+) Transcript_129503:152-826(+)